MSAPRLTLLQIHAHPDDESSKGAATMARYAAEGVHGVLVCCTGGEEGDILNKEMDRPEVKDNLHSVRMAELAEATKIIGYDTVHLLGYRDSGMPDSDANRRADNFANASLGEAVDRFARILREERPQVVITYGEDQSRYPHPDHLRVHDITGPAIERAADPAWTDGDPWQVTKLYYSHGFSRRRLLAMHDWFVSQGLESPYADWLSKIAEDHDIRVTTRIHMGDHIGTMRLALLAHRTQVEPTGWWFKVPEDEMKARHPWEEYQLAWSRVGTGRLDAEGFETDLFGGLR
ncbi:MAG: mycothiol conjugate amidase Mca [Acidimicrobiales bacterium]|nr:mycothiol conjugate amidase Mca [Acidimicrobiales bacterium]